LLLLSSIPVHRQSTSHTMASPTIEPVFSAESLSPELRTDNDSGVNNENQPIVNTSLNLQVQGSCASQQSSGKASSENTRIHSGLNDDRILPLSSSQESVRSPLTAHSAAWQSKYILTLGKWGRFGSTKIHANKHRQMAEAYEATLLYSSFRS
jgi:hypothetical protein